MKTIYIPKGETVQYEVLSADRLVVRGCLRVNSYGPTCSQSILS